MNLNEQIQQLIQDAPDLESQMSVAAIAPVLQEVAATFSQTAYYIPTSQDGSWEIVTLRHRHEPNREIRAIYAFAKIEDLENESTSTSIAQVAIVQLLFQLLATPQIDRVICFDNSHQLDRGKEILRSQLEKLIADRIQSMDTRSSLPPDVC
jgi:hypothetical protein